MRDAVLQKIFQKVKKHVTMCAVNFTQHTPRNCSTSWSPRRVSASSSRQQEIEEKLIEEETARRVEELVAKRVEEELEKRKDEIEREVLRRVEEAKRIMERQLLEELERQRQAELAAQKAREVTLGRLESSPSLPYVPPPLVPSSLTSQPLWPVPVFGSWWRLRDLPPPKKPQHQIQPWHKFHWSGVDSCHQLPLLFLFDILLASFYIMHQVCGQLQETCMYTPTPQLFHHLVCETL